MKERERDRERERERERDRERQRGRERERESFPACNFLISKQRNWRNSRDKKNFHEEMEAKL